MFVVLGSGGSPFFPTNITANEDFGGVGGNLILSPLSSSYVLKTLILNSQQAHERPSDKDVHTSYNAYFILFRVNSRHNKYYI